MADLITVRGFRPLCFIICRDKSSNQNDAEEIRWTCPDGELWIDFNGVSPFSRYPNGPRSFHVLKDTETPPANIDPRAPNGFYKYTVRVQRSDRPPPPCTKDPHIIIDDGTGLHGQTSRVIPALAIGLGVALAGWGLSQLIRRRQ
jgi:hypothetical protein